MTNLPPSRTADRIIIRLPDGMRDQLAARAKAKGRSMTAEVVSILKGHLGEPSIAELDALNDEMDRVMAELAAANRVQKMLLERHDNLIALIEKIGHRNTDD